MISSRESLPEQKCDLVPVSRNTRTRNSPVPAVSGGVLQTGGGCWEAGAGPGGAGGRGLGTGRGPVWAGPEGTGREKVETSCRLQPEAPDQQLTDVSTSS